MLLCEYLYFGEDVFEGCCVCIVVIVGGGWCYWWYFEFCFCEYGVDDGVEWCVECGGMYGCVIKVVD